MAVRVDRNELAILLQRFDLKSYVDPLVIKAEGKNEVLLECPKCLREKLSVNYERNSWRCFICEKYNVNALGRKKYYYGAGGVVSLVMWIEDCDFPAAVEHIRRFSTVDFGDGTEMPDFEFKTRRVAPNRGPTGLPDHCEKVTSLLPFMVERDITMEDADRWGLRYCTAGWAANRLIFPVWEAGQCLYWQGRAMWTREEHARWYPNPQTKWEHYRKTLNPGRKRGGQHFFGSGDVLLNLEQASRFSRVCITEGPTSAIRTGPDAIATFGKQLQPQQIARLVRAGVRAVDWMWDGPSPNEPHGTWHQACLAAQTLAPFMDVRMVRLPKGDPGDYTREWLNYFRAQAIPLAQVGHARL